MGCVIACGCVCLGGVVQWDVVTLGSTAAISPTLLSISCLITLLSCRSICSSAGSLTGRLHTSLMHCYVALHAAQQISAKVSLQQHLQSINPINVTMTEVRANNPFCSVVGWLKRSWIRSNGAVCSKFVV